jgi:hypothetical protein
VSSFDGSKREVFCFPRKDYVLNETLTLISIRLGIEAAERRWTELGGFWEWIDPSRAAAARH